MSGIVCDIVEAWSKVLKTTETPQVRDKDRRKWKEAFKVDARTMTGKVEAPLIVEDHFYEFRVIAVNKAGPSEPSDPSDTIQAKIRFMKPRIDRYRTL